MTAVLGLLLVACDSAPAIDSATPVVRDSAGVRIVLNRALENVPECRLAAEPRVIIGHVPGAEGHELYRVRGATVVSDGRIALLNGGSNELRFFSPSGEFLSASGGSGEGPGEFRNASHLHRLPGDTLWIGEYSPWHYEVFGPEGTWLRDVRPDPQLLNPPSGGGVLDDRTLILVEGNPSWSREFRPGASVVLHYGSDAQLVDTIAKLETARLGTTTNPNFYINPWFESRVMVEARGNRLVIGRGDEAQYRIFDVRDQPVLAEVVRWRETDRTVTSEELEAAREATRARYSDNGESREELMEMFLSGQRPVAEVFPAYTSIQMGTDGSIWLRRHDRVQDAGSREWVRFGPDGTLECQLVLPDRAMPAEFGSDYVLVLRRDELDVERVELLRWSRSSDAM